MTGFKDEKKYSRVSQVIEENGKEKEIRPGFERIVEDVLCFVVLPLAVDKIDLDKIASWLVNVLITAASEALFAMKNGIKSLKKVMYNIMFSPLDPSKHVKVHSMDDLIKEKVKDPQTIEKHNCNGRKRLTVGSKEGENLNFSLDFLFGKVSLYIFPIFETLSDCRNTENQVMEPIIILQALKHVFELIVYLEELIRNYKPEISHSKIATHILRGWNNCCIPKEGVTLKYFLAFFIHSIGIYVNVCIKFTQEVSHCELPKPTEKEPDKPAENQQARARVPAMTKAGLKEHMASLRQMWCQEFSAGLAEELLREDRQRALRRFGKEQGLKQHEIDNILNRSSASLQEKAYRLMEDWQHGRGGSVMRRGKQLEEEQFIETIEALKRDRNSREDKDT